MAERKVSKKVAAAISSDVRWTLVNSIDTNSNDGIPAIVVKWIESALNDSSYWTTREEVIWDLLEAI